MYRSDASSHGYIREPLWDSFNDGNDGDLPKEEDNPTFLGSTKHLFMHGRLNLLLIFFPFAVAAEYLGISEVGTFFICMLAIIPMAERIAYLSEQLTLYTNAVIGALMTVTFANISELCINLAALFKGYYKTILWNAVGSIHLNLLLVLGVSFAVGGYYHGVQTYSRVPSQVDVSLLMLSVLSLLLPAMLYGSYDASSVELLGFSRTVSVALITAYICFVGFQVSEHRSIYESTIAPIGQSEGSERSRSPSLGATIELPEKRTTNPMNNASVGLNHLQTTAQTGTSYDRTPEFGSLNGSPRVNITSSAQVASHDRQKIEFKAGVFWLSILVAATAIASINFVNAIEGTAETLMISDTFISGILLPLPSGAVEASASIVFAAKNKLNSSLEICLGSSCQIAALILPLFVLIGWVFDRRMTYRFEGFEGITYFVTLMMTVLIIKDGKSTMLLGLLLMIAYFIVGVAYFVHKSDLEM